MLRFDSDGVYRAASLEQFPWIEHGFGTAVSTNFPPLSTIRTTKQIHSDIVLVADDDRQGLVGEGDAIVSNRPGLAVGVRTADCLPILLADTRQRIVAAIHAGWRGTVSGIVMGTVELLQRQYGTQAADVWAAMGPGIGNCCFEVDPDVGQQFAGIFPERQDLHKRAKVDLAEANWRLLKRLGVPDDQIELAELCTCCGGDTFHSYRRAREAAGRMIAFVGIRTG